MQGKLWQKPYGLRIFLGHLIAAMHNGPHLEQPKELLQSVPTLKLEKLVDAVCRAVSPENLHIVEHFLGELPRVVPILELLFAEGWRPLVFAPSMLLVKTVDGLPDEGAGLILLNWLTPEEWFSGEGEGAGVLAEQLGKARELTQPPPELEGLLAILDES